MILYINKIELNYSAHEAYLFRANLQTSVCLAGSTGCGAIMCICTFTEWLQMGPINRWPVMTFNQEPWNVSSQRTHVCLVSPIWLNVGQPIWEILNYSHTACQEFSEDGKFLNWRVYSRSSSVHGPCVPVSAWNNIVLQWSILTQRAAGVTEECRPVLWYNTIWSSC